MMMSNSERDTLLDTLRPFVIRGDYKSALTVSKAAFKKYPTDFTARYQYAKILGDWADELPPKKQAALKKEAVKILKPLLKALRGKPMLDRFGLCLNYYYQSQDWRGMLAFGRRFASTNRQKAFYAQGLATAMLAQSLFDAGKVKSARAWAVKSVRIWRKYDLKSDAYYFAHYNSAKAFAIAGDADHAMLALKKTAKLGKRKVDDWEFADVLKILKTN